MVAFFPAPRGLADLLITVEPKHGDIEPARRRAARDVLWFSGLAMDRGTLVRSSEDLRAWLARTGASVDHVANLTGTFTAVLAIGQEIFVMVDRCGMLPLYLYHGDRLSIISNRLHLVALEMARRGIRRSPDYETICCAVASDNIFFQQAHTGRTQMRDVTLVPVHQYIRIDAKGVVSKQARYTFEPNDKVRDYDSLIEESVGDIKANIAALVGSKEFRCAIIDLSGGLDSRMVFASAVSAGVLKGAYVRTLPEGSPGDFEIGTTILRRYNARLFAGDGRRRYSRATSFGLDFWRSMKAGAHHRIGIGNWPTLGCGRPSLHLYGASGELYREQWLKIACPRIETDPEDRLAIRVFEEICRPQASRLQRQLSWSSFDDALAQIPGASLRDRLSNHYAFFRNRFHYGLTPFNLWYGLHDISLVQSRPMFEAWRCLPQNDRRRGKVIFDLVEALTPELNRLPYAKGYRWPAEYLARDGSGAGDRDASLLTRQQCEQVWQSAWAHETKRLNERAAEVDSPPFEPRHLTAARCAREAAQSSIQADARLADVLGDDLWARLDEAEARPTAPGLELCSKLLAVYDLCISDDQRALDPSALPASTRMLADFKYSVSAQPTLTVIGERSSHVTQVGTI